MQKSRWLLKRSDFKPSDRVMNQSYRILFNIMFWLFAAYLASLIDGISTHIASLEEPLKAFFVERVSTPMVIFQAGVLSIVVGIVVVIPVEEIREEAISEAYRLWYTVGAAAGAVQVVSSHWLSAIYFYMFGVFVPWIVMASGFRSDLINLSREKSCAELIAVKTALMREEVLARRGEVASPLRQRGFPAPLFDDWSLYARAATHRKAS